MVELPSLEIFKKCVDVTVETWFTDGLGNVRLLVGLNGLTGLFQCKLFCD